MTPAERLYFAVLADRSVWRVKVTYHTGEGWCVFWCPSGDDTFTGDCCPYPDFAIALDEIASDATAYRGHALVALYEATPVPYP